MNNNIPKRQRRETLFDVNKKFGEDYSKFRPDSRNKDWEKAVMLASTKLITVKQSYARIAAKELANMLSNGTLDLSKVNVISQSLQKSKEKEFVEYENVNDAISILEALKNTFGNTIIKKNNE